MEASQQITRKSASNLALAFILLPREKREAMSALYAFCREVDDIADEVNLPIEDRRAQLQAWREDLRRVFVHGHSPEFPVNRDLRSILPCYPLKQELFEELLNGVEMDLNVKRYPNWEELETYCYRVASVVGLLSIEIFGYTDPACEEYAVSLGKALQLTNILRDVRIDAVRDRIYLPQTELDRFKVNDDEILAFNYSPRYFEAAQSVAEKARSFYRSARQSLPLADRRTMIAAELMGSIYWRLLKKLEQRRFNVFQPPLVKVGKAEKLWLIARAWWRISSGSPRPNYGT